MGEGSVKAIAMSIALIAVIAFATWGLKAIGGRVDRAGLVAQAELLTGEVSANTETMLALNKKNQRLALENSRLRARLAAVESAVTNDIEALELTECVATPEFLESLSRLADARG